MEMPVIQEALRKRPRLDDDGPAASAQQPVQPLRKRVSAVCGTTVTTAQADSAQCAPCTPEHGPSAEVDAHGPSTGVNGVEVVDESSPASAPEFVPAQLDVRALRALITARDAALRTRLHEADRRFQEGMRHWGQRRRVHRACASRGTSSRCNGGSTSPLICIPAGTAAAAAQGWGPTAAPTAAAAQPPHTPSTAVPALSSSGAWAASSTPVPRCATPCSAGSHLQPVPASAWGLPPAWLPGTQHKLQSERTHSTAASGASTASAGGEAAVAAGSQPTAADAIRVMPVVFVGVVSQLLRLCPHTTRRLAVHIWRRVEGRLRQQALLAAANVAAVRAASQLQVPSCHAAAAPVAAPAAAEAEAEAEAKAETETETGAVTVSEGASAAAAAGFPSARAPAVAVPAVEVQQLGDSEQLLALIPARVYAVAAVWIASKLEELREQVPSTAALAAIARSSPAVLSEAELRILQWCDWAPMAGFVPAA